jgi:hypothetical protein
MAVTAPSACLPIQPRFTLISRRARRRARHKDARGLPSNPPRREWRANAKRGEGANNSSVGPIPVFGGFGLGETVLPSASRLGEVSGLPATYAWCNDTPPAHRALRAVIWRCRRSRTQHFVIGEEGRLPQ